MGVRRDEVPRRAGVSGVATDGAGRVLCVLRAREPLAGRWSLPGGKVEAGESADAALVREMLEETGLAVEVGDVVGRVEVSGREGEVYEVEVRAVVVLGPRSGGGAPGASRSAGPVGAAGAGGEPRAGSDAADARWLSRAELEGRRTTPGLVDLLDGVGAFDPARSGLR